MPPGGNMKAYQNFRLFYNQSIHPELLNLERRRARIVRLMFFFALFIFGLIVLAFMLNVFVFTLLVIAMLIFGISRIVFMVQVFFREYKPRIVSLILDFIDNNPNYSRLAYDAAGTIPKSTFQASQIYITTADEYQAEDHISGYIREMPFALCELRVLEISPVRTQMDTIFSGIFMTCDFLRNDLKGKLWIMPDVFRKYQAASARAIHLQGAKRIDYKLSPSFESLFDTYANEDFRIQESLSLEFQQVLINFYHKTQRPLSLAIIHSKLYIALSVEADMLEPQLFRNNTSFEVVNQYYEDIQLLLDLILAMDVLN